MRWFPRFNTLSGRKKTLNVAQRVVTRAPRREEQELGDEGIIAFHNAGRQKRSSASSSSTDDGLEKHQAADDVYPRILILHALTGQDIIDVCDDTLGAHLNHVPGVTLGRIVMSARNIYADKDGNAPNEVFVQLSIGDLLAYFPSSPFAVCAFTKKGQSHGWFTALRLISQRLQAEYAEILQSNAELLTNETERILAKYTARSMISEDIPEQSHRNETQQAHSDEILQARSDEIQQCLNDRISLARTMIDKIRQAHNPKTCFLDPHVCGLSPAVLSSPGDQKKNKQVNLKRFWKYIQSLKANYGKKKTRPYPKWIFRSTYWRIKNWNKENWIEVLPDNFSLRVLSDPPEFAEKEGVHLSQRLSGFRIPESRGGEARNPETLLETYPELKTTPIERNERQGSGSKSSSSSGSGVLRSATKTGRREKLDAKNRASNNYVRPHPHKVSTVDYESIYHISPTKPPGVPRKHRREQEDEDSEEV